MKEICEKFNKYDFHDSKLISFKVIRKKQGEMVFEDICFDLQLLMDTGQGHYKFKKAELIFKDCGFVRMDLDLIGKQQCSDSIMSITCYIESPLKKDIESSYFQRGPVSLNSKDFENYLSEYLHFCIKLIPPGGMIDIFAKNFELKIENV